MYEPMNLNVESVGPGLREYNVLSRGDRSFVSGLGRPIGCFTILGAIMTAIGTIVFFLVRNQESEEYTPFRTFGSTFIAIGLLVLVISTFLLCEATLTGRFNRDPESNRSSREDLRSTSSREDLRHHLSREDLRASISREDLRTIGRTVISFASVPSSRRVSVIEDEGTSPSQPLLINQGSSEPRTTYKTFTNFPFPIPTVKVHTESGETIPSSSL